MVITSLSKCLGYKSTVYLFWFYFVTVVGNDGFYIILKGLARPLIQVYKNLLEESESTTFIPQSFHSFVINDNLENVVLAEMHTPPCNPTVRSESAPPSTAGHRCGRTLSLLDV